MCHLKKKKSERSESRTNDFITMIQQVRTDLEMHIKDIIRG